MHCMKWVGSIEEICKQLLSAKDVRGSFKKIPLHKSFYAGEVSHKISNTHLPDFIDVELLNIVRGIYKIALIAFVEFIKAGIYKGLVEFTKANSWNL